VSGCCEDSDEHSGSIICGEFFDYAIIHYLKRNLFLGNFIIITSMHLWSGNIVLRSVERRDLAATSPTVLLCV
jgi:hypothetical protein